LSAAPTASCKPPGAPSTPSTVTTSSSITTFWSESVESGSGKLEAVREGSLARDHSSDELHRFCNLDTGEERYLSNALIDSSSFLSIGQQPRRRRAWLCREGQKPWKLWWRQKHEKDRAMSEALIKCDVLRLHSTLSVEPVEAPLTLQVGGLQGYQSLRAACAAGAADVVRMLIQAGVDLHSSSSRRSSSSGFELQSQRQAAKAPGSQNKEGEDEFSAAANEPMSAELSERAAGGSETSRTVERQQEDEQALLPVEASASLGSESAAAGEAHIGMAAGMTAAMTAASAAEAFHSKALGASTTEAEASSPKHQKTKVDEGPWSDSELSLLHVAARAGHTEVIGALLEAKADVHAATGSGDLPIHFACRSGRPAAIRRLLSEGGSEQLSKRNSIGKTPLELISDPDTLRFAASIIADRGNVDSYRLRSLSCGDHPMPRPNRSDAVCKFLEAGRAAGQQRQREHRLAALESTLEHKNPLREAPPHNSDMEEFRSFVASRGRRARSLASLFAANLEIVQQKAACGVAAVKQHRQLRQPPQQRKQQGQQLQKQQQQHQHHQQHQQHYYQKDRSSQDRRDQRDQPISKQSLPGSEEQPRWVVRSLSTQKSFAKLDHFDDIDEEVGPSTFATIRTIGQGSFGAVYMVKHNRTGGIYAMKTLEKSKIRSQNLERYAKTERNILSYVRHPFIVSLRFAFQTTNYLVLVLHYCPNGNLQRLIAQERRLSEALARLYTAEVLLAITHLHHRNIVFRDLKPDNIVLDDGWHAMLTDFGLSKEGVQGAGATTFCGSVAYIAPEILARKPHGHTVDIYNLGVLLFNMLTGAPPFYHPNRKLLFDNIAKAKLRIPFLVSAKASSFIKVLMERDPERRLGHKSTDELRDHAFFENLDWDDVLNRKVPVPANASALARRSSSSSTDVPLTASALDLAALSTGALFASTVPGAEGQDHRDIDNDYFDGRGGGGGAADPDRAMDSHGRLRRGQSSPLPSKKPRRAKKAATPVTGWDFAAQSARGA